MKTIIYVGLFTLLWVLADGALFSWLFKGYKSVNVDKDEGASDSSRLEHGQFPHGAVDVNTDVAMSVNVPFESRSSDEKFLIEAAKYTSLQISELDKCQHLVILGLQASCADISNEELSKVAVNLFNCQSVAEGRQIYPCTSDMTLEQCTKGMDPNTWNAYHIVSNRVRAVCYSARQEQFRAKTEMTVNKLMQSAEDQIRSMSDIQESQEALGKATSETFESLSEGHEYLKKQQNQLSAAQNTIHNFVSSNLRELYKEKRIIAAGQRELAYITEAIKKKLDEAKHQLAVQEESQRGVHSHILKDLSEIQDDARKVWGKLDASTANILLKHEETLQQFSQLKQDLQDMNVTVHHLMNVLQATRGAVEDKLSWISSLVGDTDNTLQKVYSCILHAGYFLIGMLAASFLQVPYLTRVVLVVLVPLNALSEIKNESSLHFSTLTTLLALCVLVNLLFTLFMGFYRRHRLQFSVRDEVRQFLKYEMQECSSTAVADISGSKFLSDHTITSKIKTSTPPPPGTPNIATVTSSTCNDGYSSDEELLPTPVPKSSSSSFLRKRVLDDSLLSHKENNVSDSPSLIHQDDGISLKDYDSNTNLHLDSSDVEKTVSSVRRHLLDHLENPPRSVGLLNSSFSVGTRSRRSTPMRETPASSRSGTPSRSMTPKKLCAAACKNGQLCRNVAGSESFYCHRHDTSAVVS